MTSDDTEEIRILRQMSEERRRREATMRQMGEPIRPRDSSVYVARPIFEIHVAGLDEYAMYKQMQVQHNGRPQLWWNPITGKGEYLEFDPNARF